MNNIIQIAGTDVEFTITGRDTILRAALRNGIPISYECNSGGCGSCKIDVVDGEIETLWEEAPGLTPRDKRRNRKLACQCIAKGAATIKAQLTDNKLPEVRPSRRRAQYVGRRYLTPDMAEFYFQADDSACFLPGQYAMLTLPGIDGDRAYSMSNVANDSGRWHFIIKRMPGGSASNWLFDKLEPGSIIEIDAPFGHAYLHPEIQRDVVCIAGGSGLSPVMSIIRAITGDSRFSERNVYLFYGGRTPKDLCVDELLSEIKPTNAKAKVICKTAISDYQSVEKEKWEGPCCYIHELAEKTLNDRIMDFEYYFCGPPKLTEAVQRMLMIDHKVPFDRIHFDRFF
ncbi:MAG: 2Fe-2S iron-sulfur cluster-binding protein [Pseudomonadota bacterium]|jgi:toluene monooxygenase electron transfer component|nr:2Fe-2S iron-sulfur cluster-binding protein [Pseudomonadota bacterium]